MIFKEQPAKKKLPILGELNFCVENEFNTARGFPQNASVHF